MENYFECDEFIAPIISLLNKKGYRTKFCCEGHLYDQEIIGEYTFKKGEKPNENTILGYIHHKLSNKFINRYFVYSKHSALHGYITFESYVDFGKYLDSFPETGVYTFYHNNVIRWDYIDEDDKSFVEIINEEKCIQAEPYKHFETRLRFLKDVYKWVEKLPDYSTCITDEKKKEYVLMVNDIPRIKKIMKSKLNNPPLLEKFFHIFFMNKNLISNMPCDYNQMLEFDLDAKVDFFMMLYKKMVITNKDGEQSIVIETKRQK